MNGPPSPRVSDDELNGLADYGCEELRNQGCPLCRKRDIGCADVQRPPLGSHPSRCATRNARQLNVRWEEPLAICGVSVIRRGVDRVRVGEVTTMLRCLGRAARGARKRAGKRTIHVAVALDKDTATIQRFERGETQPRNLDQFVDAYAKAIGVDAKAIWTDALDRYLDERKP